MTEQLISFETAKLAKEKGFDIPTKTAYIGNEFFESEETPNGYDGYDPSFTENWNKKGWVTNKEGGMCFGCKLDNIKYFEAYTVTSQSLLQKWLRDKHNIHVNVSYDLTFTFKINGDLKGSPYIKYPEISDFWGRTYEEALEKGLQEALKLIK